MTFEHLNRFLYVNLFKGIAVGNLPRPAPRGWKITEREYVRNLDEL
ncbi:hypothetical protein [uncultured Dysosmobacter sp.]|nr:hypothetical protein [uncultured Dysosmobacter sp.]